MSCFTQCAALLVAETPGHCGPLALLAMSPAKQTFLQDVTWPLVWPHVPVLCDCGRLALREAQTLQALCRRSVTHSTETTTTVSTLAGEPSKGDSLCRTGIKQGGNNFLSPWESAGAQALVFFPPQEQQNQSQKYFVNCILEKTL